MIAKKIYMILTNGFDPDVRVLKEAEYLVSKHFDVEVLCWDRRIEYQTQQYEELNTIKIRRFPIQSTYGSGMKQILPYIKFIFQVRKYLKRREYTYLHCHDFDGMLVGLLTKKKKNTKLIFDMHEIYTHYGYAKNGIFKSIFKKVLNKVNYIIYVNEEQIKNYDSYKDKMVYLPNYPRKEDYFPIQKEVDNLIRINYIGSLRDYDSLKCLASLKNEKYKIGIYGNGVCYQKLYTEFSSKVYFHGKYNGIKDSRNIYQKTDILYCVYNPEIENWKNAYPVKLYEAIITNTPIIVSLNSSVSRFVEKYGIGVSVEYNNPESLKAGIKKIVKDYKKYVFNIKKIENDYNWDFVVSGLLKIYSGDIENE